MNGTANGECALKKREYEGKKMQGQNSCSMAFLVTQGACDMPHSGSLTHFEAPSSHHCDFHSLVSYFSADVIKYPNKCS